MNQPNPKGHPKGLYVLFATEMWERFNYYGMRAILVYFMTDALLFSKPFASNLYGGYTSLVYLTPLIGGFIADRYWGNRRSIIMGGLVMALAEIVLFFCASLYTSSPEVSSILFYVGLGMMIVGNGFFKPNISSMVGQLYSQGDQRTDSAYTIFYMGINVGGMLGPFICGLVGNTGNPDDFKWAFLVGAIGMLLSVITMKYLQDKYLVSHANQPIGVVPEHMADSSSPIRNPLSPAVILGLAGLVAVAVGLLYAHSNKIFDLSFLMIGALAVILYVIFSDKTLNKIETKRLIAIFVVSFFVVFFWSAYEQAGASLAFFAAEQTNLHMGFLNFDIPPSWFQSLNSLFVILFAPLFAWLWLTLGTRKLEPSSPAKMALGLFLLALGYLWIAFGVKGIEPNVKVSMIWLTGMYALHTWGELCLSPIGLSLVNKMAPLRFASLMMAVWFMANAAANVLAGKLSALYPAGPGEIKKASEAGINLPDILSGKLTATPEQIETLKKLDIPYTFNSILGYQINNLYDYFIMFVIMAGVASLILFGLTGWLQRLMKAKA
ncbi:MAG: peptide MFS transporter [Chitinophagaceae bacterium]|nr:peptide MFS transporter [Chitinophagaceae bacterium]